MRTTSHILTSLIVFTTAAAANAQGFFGYYPSTQPVYTSAPVYTAQPYVANRPCYSGNCGLSGSSYLSTTSAPIYTTIPSTTYTTNSIRFDPTYQTQGCYGGRCAPTSVVGSNCVNGNCTNCLNGANCATCPQCNGYNNGLNTGANYCPSCQPRPNNITYPTTGPVWQNQSTIPGYNVAPGYYHPRFGENNVDINLTSTPTVNPPNGLFYSGSQPVANSPYFN